ncbi:MAG: D-alanine--D-alanine ligase [Bacteroidia bacterium]
MTHRIALMFGGKSPEHEVSIRSARNIFAAIDKTKYDVVLIGVGRTGKWYHIDEEVFIDDPFEIDNALGEQLAILPGLEHDQIIRLSDDKSLGKIEAVFPIIHGPNGEDGTLQGMLTQLNLPFVGPGVLGSSVAMDKDVCKRLFKEAGLFVANGLVFHHFEKDAVDYQAVVNQLGSPLFIKPCNMGSSVGVSKATNEAEFQAAIQLAFQFDTKVIVEEMLVGRELECAVLGNEFPEASGVGEVIVSKGFYDYETKYVTDDAQIMIPAENISEFALEKIRMVARQAFQVLGCEGMSRVDVFLTKDEDIYINEINTLPGFTSISMYPKLWEKAGLPYDELIDNLLQLAIARTKRDNTLQRSRI